jgi:molybdenum cofactor synthesis domain-containing protein
MIPIVDSVKTAGIIIIGNEILSGKVRDTNSPFLASELRDLGISLRRISVIPDDAGIIGREVQEFSGRYDYVFTSGGIGPTHDDVTVEGVARGFGVKVIRHPDLLRYFHWRYGDKVNPAIMKMTEVPEGAEIIDLGDMSFPLLSFRNIFVFPGIPRYLEEKFAAIKERFRCPACHLKRLFLKANESDIAETLNGVVAGNTEVTFGSYPILDNPEYTVIVTAESRSLDSLNAAFAELVRRLPRNILVRVE